MLDRWTRLLSAAEKGETEPQHQEYCNLKGLQEKHLKFEKERKKFRFGEQRIQTALKPET